MATMSMRNQSLIAAQARTKQLEDAALFALDVLISCVVDGPGCDDPLARKIAIDKLQTALAEPVA